MIWEGCLACPWGWAQGQEEGPSGQPDLAGWWEQVLTNVGETLLGGMLPLCEML